MGLHKDLKTLLGLHYVVNILLSLSFILLKTTYPLCSFIFPASPCELEWREWEILTFLAVVIVFRSRRSGTTSMLSYLGTSFMYCKVANLILYFYVDPRTALFFGIVCLFQSLLLPEPAYAGPDNIIYFRGDALKEELEKDRRVMWVVAFYAAWSPACVTFAPIFAELSANYHLDNLKFGKVDVARYPEIARDFYINDSSFSRQLPSVILFRSGKEDMRRPMVDGKRQLVKFFFSEDNMKAAFDLNNLYNECKSKPLKERKKKVDEAQAHEETAPSADGKLKAE